MPTQSDIADKEDKKKNEEQKDKRRKMKVLPAVRRTATAQLAISRLPVGERAVKTGEPPAGTRSNHQKRQERRLICDALP